MLNQRESLKHDCSYSVEFYILKTTLDSKNKTPDTNNYSYYFTYLCFENLLSCFI